jgi:diguanylate cyclase (GGDEF)-like protein
MRREQTPLSIILCALEEMDSYKAAYGEEAYEQCLQEIAQAIRGCVQRSSDVVARYEEHKFAVLLPNTPLEGANYVAEKIQKQVSTLSCCELTKQPAITLRFAVETQVPNPEKEAQGLAQSALKSLG